MIEIKISTKSSKSPPSGDLGGRARGKIWRENKGYTLIELLTVMLLSTIVMGVIYLSFSYVGKSVIRWQQYNKAVSQTSKVSNFFEHEFRNITKIDTVVNDSLSYKDENGVKNSIYCKGGKLLFNTRSVLGRDCIVDSLNFNWLVKKTESDSGSVNGTMKEIRYLVE